jgi:hypothetical protein
MIEIRVTKHEGMYITTIHSFHKAYYCSLNGLNPGPISGITPEFVLTKIKAICIRILLMAVLHLFDTNYYLNVLYN